VWRIFLMDAHAAKGPELFVAQLRQSDGPQVEDQMQEFTIAQIERR
jgi:hypothetical protein